MSIPKLDLELYEGSILDTCWKVGGSKSRTSTFSQLDRNEIAAVNIVACCKQINDLIEENSSKICGSSVLATRKKQNLSFKDITRLAHGVTDIYRCQVDILLGDTKHLLDQMRRTNLDFVVTTTKSVVVKESEIRVNRKRKRLVTKKSKVTVSKRPRCQESELLNKASQEYYKKMLSECQIWQSECTHQLVEELQSIELPGCSTQSSSYHAITIFEGRRSHEDHSTIIPSEGFGDSDELDLTIFEELYPKKFQTQSLKRPSITQDPTYILPDKMPRLDELNIFQADNAIMTQIFPDNIEPADTTEKSCEPLLESFYYPPVEISYSQPKNPRKRKLIIDKQIKYSQEQLVKHRQKYMDDHNTRVLIVQNTSATRKKPYELLSKLNKNNIFPHINHPVVNLTTEMEYEAENTLRTIFGSEFTVKLTKEIFVPAIEIKQSGNQEVYIHQPVPLEQEDIVPPILHSVDVIKQSNNNNFYKQSTHCENNFDTHSVMMDLLDLWRNNPNINGITANDFIKSFKDRTKASLAFLHLLYLVRDNFIEISKRANSIEMDQITLGKESIKLIENLMQSKTF